jgi:AcrR family transcriptional regulator
MSKPKDDQKIELIRTACIRIVMQTGFNGLRMADVAKEAGIATGTLYIYYPDKQSLVTDAFRRTKLEISEALFRFTTEGNDFTAVFRGWWFNYFNFAISNPDKILFAEQFLYSGLIPSSVIEETDRLFLPLDAFLVNAREAGLILRLDTEIIKAQLTAPVHTLLKVKEKNPELLDQQSVEGIFQMAWQSIQPNK